MLKKDGKKGTLYKDDHKPLALYKNGKKVAGWDKVSKSGTEFDFQNTYNAKFDKLNVYGKSEQKQYQGYQIIDFEDCNFGNNRGVQSSFDKTTNELVLNGVCTEDGWVGIITLKHPMTLIGDFVCSQTSNLRISLINQNWYAIFSVIGSVSVNIPQEKQLTYIAFMATEGEVFNNVHLKFQLEKGTVLHDYEPYTGGIPSPNPQYPQPIISTENPKSEIRVKNLLDISSFRNTNIGGVTFSKAGDHYILNGTAELTAANYLIGTSISGTEENIYLPQKGEKYVFNYPDLLGFSANLVYGGKYVAVKNSPFIYDKIHGLRVQVQKGAVFNNTELWLQIEEGSVATDFEPYHTPQELTPQITLHGIPVSSDGNVTIDGQQYISDYFDAVNKGVWRCCRKVNMWEAPFSLHENTYISFGVLDASNNYALCNIALKKRFDWNWGYWTRADVRFLIGVQNSPYSNRQEFQKFFEDSMACFIYPVQTPYFEPLTDEQLEVAKCYYPSTYFKTDAPFAERTVKVFDK